MTLAKTVSLLLVILILAASAPAQTPEPGAQQQVPIFLTVEPSGLPLSNLGNPFDVATTAPGVPVTIHGVTSRGLSGQAISVIVTPPQRPEPSKGHQSKCQNDSDLVAAGRTKPQPPTMLTAAVGSSGTFDLTYTPVVTGRHEVSASGGNQTGQTHFEVERPEGEEDCEELSQEEFEHESAALIKNAEEIVDIVDEKVRQLPPSPPKDELAQQIRTLRDQMRQGSSDRAPRWTKAIGEIRKIHELAPETRPATRKLREEMKGWLTTARRANEKAVTVKAQLTKGNVICDKLDVVVNGMKACDFLLGIATTPANFVKDFAKENVLPKLIGMIPVMKRTPPVQQGVEVAWKRMYIAGEGMERAVGFKKLAVSIAGYAGNRLFEHYCQQFQGPVSGSMRAMFFQNGQLWWEFEIEIEGDITLRYPKDASGEVIALTGEVVGNAKKFKSSDEAFRVLYPKLMLGTIIKSFRLEPLDLSTFKFLNPVKKLPGFQKVPGGGEAPDLNPISSALEQGGPVAKNLITPAFFRVPLRGELREKTLRFELLDAIIDFDDVRTKVWVLFLPVTSMWPEFQSYALPYKGARFMMFRAMNDGPVEFTITRDKKVMRIERKFERKREAGDTKGDYSLSVKACNPGWGC